MYVHNRPEVLVVVSRPRPNTSRLEDTRDHTASPSSESAILRIRSKYWTKQLGSTISDLLRALLNLVAISVTGEWLS